MYLGPDPVGAGSFFRHVDPRIISVDLDTENDPDHTLGRNYL